MRKLVVILGAGASADCIQGSEEGYAVHTPPVVKELFDSRFSHILNQYPLAQVEAASVRHSLARETIGLEEHLLALRDARDDPYGQQRWREVPLYLQHLLWHVSQPLRPNREDGGFTDRPSNYDRLANEVLKLDEVVFITLNYDTILDQRLARYGGDADTLDWYVERDRNWSLIKLHGSVNWGYPLREKPPIIDYGNGHRLIAHLGAGLTYDPTITHLGNHASIEALRWSGQPNGWFHYPALSVPLGPSDEDDELNCPPEHRDFLRNRLAEMGSINLLVIGYSGLDEAAIRFLKDAESSLRRVLIVNGSRERGVETASRIAAGVKQPLSLSRFVFAGGFRDFMAGDHLEEFLAKL